MPINRPQHLVAPVHAQCCGWQAMGVKKARQLTFDPQLTPEDREYLRKLPFTLSMPSHGVCVVHAGFVPGVPIQQQSLEDMIEVCVSMPASTAGAGGARCAACDRLTSRSV